MKKRIVAYGVLISLIGVYLCYRIFFPLTGVSLLNYYHIEPGMHANEIDALFGGPNKDGFGRQGLPIRVANQGWVETWHGETIFITVFYDRDERVVEKEWGWLRPNWADRDWRDWLWPPNWFRVQKIRE